MRILKQESSVLNNREDREGSGVLFSPPELSLSPHPLIITASNINPDLGLILMRLRREGVI